MLRLLVRACERTFVLGEGDRKLVAARGLARCGGPDDLDWWTATEDAELRWLAVYRLTVLGADVDIAAEVERDRSAAGREHAARCRAARPDPAAKAAAWRSIVDGTGQSHRLLIATANGFWQPEQEELTREYVPRYFAELPTLVDRYTPQLLGRLAETAYPRFAVALEKHDEHAGLAASRDVDHAARVRFERLLYREQLRLAERNRRGKR